MECVGWSLDCVCCICPTVLFHYAVCVKALTRQFRFQKRRLAYHILCIIAWPFQCLNGPMSRCCGSVPFFVQELFGKFERECVGMLLTPLAGEAVILMLGERVVGLPWETLSVFKDKVACRMPSLKFTIAHKHMVSSTSDRPIR